jgi:hypothetical protein
MQIFHCLHVAAVQLFGVIERAHVQRRRLGQLVAHSLLSCTGGRAHAHVLVQVADARLLVLIVLFRRQHRRLLRQVELTPVELVLQPPHLVGVRHLHAVVTYNCILIMSSVCADCI